ncbi:MAG: hypothetical protein H0T42_18490 [Deltaproteobacteria bacterium]|nr:hypothetical protein [Deltaproteobacteria bacterium]
MQLGTLMSIGLAAAACSSERSSIVTQNRSPPPSSSAPRLEIKRNFRKEGAWSFDYRQTMTSSLNDSEKMDANATGELTVTSNQDGTAKGRMSLQLTSTPGAGTPRSVHDTMDLTFTESTVVGTRGDSMQALTTMLMPAPTRPLHVGETATTTFSIPLTTQGSAQPISGPMTLTLVGYDTVRGVQCARIESRVRLDQTVEGSRVRVDLDGNACIDPGDALIRTSSVEFLMELSMKDGLRGYGPETMKLTGRLELDRR